MEQETSDPSRQKNRTENINFIKITHLFLFIPNPPGEFIKEMTQNCYNFIWNGGLDEIKRDVTSQNVTEGGLGMLDIPMFVKSLNIAWIRRSFTTEANGST